VGELLSTAGEIAITVAPWATVTIVAISKLYRLAMVWIVRSAPSDMFVDERRLHFTVRRGRPDLPREVLPKRTRLRSVASSEPSNDPPTSERAGRGRGRAHTHRRQHGRGGCPK
jgi:hypothetical protein